MRLILVHGRSQQGKDPAELKKEWVSALREGLQKQGLVLPANLEVELPFYGDKLDDFVSQFDIPLSEDITTRGGDVDADYLDFRADMLQEFQRRAGLSDIEVDAEYGDNPKPKGPQNWEWVHAGLRALDKHVPGMTDRTLELFMRDVFLYIRRAGVRDEIDEIVARALSPESSIVIGHSLGSVVSYSVLRRDPRALKIRLYVTLGSPLAVRSIRNEFRPLRFPKVVSAWYNAYDERDVVALYPLDGSNFPVKPPVENNGSILNDTNNRHGITGYLKNPTVAKRIHATLVSG